MGGLSRGEGAPFDCMLVTPISRISGFAGTEPLQRHYKPLQGRYRPLQSCYGAVTSRYGAVTNLTSRYGVGWLQRACTLQRHWLRSQPSSDGCALGGTSLSAPATGGFSVVSPSPNVCDRLQGREAGRGPTSWGHYSTFVLILQVGLQVGRAGSLFRGSLGK